MADGNHSEGLGSMYFQITSLMAGLKHSESNAMRGMLLSSTPRSNPTKIDIGTKVIIMILMSRIVRLDSNFEQSKDSANWRTLGAC